ncbi:MAG: exodeoxyribonuclease VII small subunit [Vampirovibrionales bacterium]|nr:exodeoxyribonuclease VII small subunit [Vampirovibrionales bacterium]
MNPNPQPTFSSSANALDTIIDRFKSSDLTLEEALQLFEEGVGHLKVCQSHLGVAKGKVEELVQTLQEEGEVITEAFGDDEEE